MGGERAETYLRLRAEVELRRAGAELRALDAALGTEWSDPGMEPWWLLDGAGNWHIATPDERSTIAGEGTQAFRLRLTPPLAAVPDAAEVVVTGPATRVRATVPVGPAPA
jgi:hypothetical protein